MQCYYSYAYFSKVRKETKFMFFGIVYYYILASFVHEMYFLFAKKNYELSTFYANYGISTWNWLFHVKNSCMITHMYAGLWFKMLYPLCFIVVYHPDISFQLSIFDILNNQVISTQQITEYYL